MKQSLTALAKNIVFQYYIFFPILFELLSWFMDKDHRFSLILSSAFESDIAIPINEKIFIQIIALFIMFRLKENFKLVG